MNYLGHLVLSPFQATIRTANLVADWIDILDYSSLSKEIQIGIELHRAIDSFTDHHPAVREMNRLLRPLLHKYSPVGSDLIIDFLIAHHWYRFHNCSYTAFCSDMYIQMEISKIYFPDLIATRISKMVGYRWLDNKQDSKSWQYTLLNMDKRARFPSNFVGVQHLLLDKFAVFRSLFESFYLEASEKFPSEYHIDRYKSNPQN